MLYPHRIKSRATSPVAKERPVIKVTVTPRSTQTPNVLKKRKNLAKRVQTSVSNHENCISPKNIYLVVPSGRKKDKVYQIKTTGSAKFPKTYSCLKDEVIPIEQLSSLKLVLDSLNMDKKNEKNKKRRKKFQGNPDNFETFKNIGESGRFCECPCYYESRKEESPDVAFRKSFVRISGHLDLSEDDRYVLKCSANVNEKPCNGKPFSFYAIPN